MAFTRNNKTANGRNNSARTAGAKGTSAGTGGDKKFRYVNIDLVEMLEFINKSIEDGQPVHINVDGTSLRFRSGETCYSKVLKAMEDGSLYGSIKPEDATADSDFSAFQRRELA